MCSCCNNHVTALWSHNGCHCNIAGHSSHQSLAPLSSSVSVCKMYLVFVPLFSYRFYFICSFLYPVSVCICYLLFLCEMFVWWMGGKKSLSWKIKVFSNLNCWFLYVLMQNEAILAVPVLLWLKKIYFLNCLWYQLINLTHI